MPKRMKAYPHKNLYTNIHSSNMHNSPKSGNHPNVWWMDKQILVYSYQDSYSARKRNGYAIVKPTIVHNMGKSQKHYSKWKKPDMKDAKWVISFI